TPPHRDPAHSHPHSFPTRRSSDLTALSSGCTVTSMSPSGAKPLPDKTRMSPGVNVDESTSSCASSVDDAGVEGSFSVSANAAGAPNANELNASADPPRTAVASRPLFCSSSAVRYTFRASETQLHSPVLEPAIGTDIKLNPRSLVSTRAHVSMTPITFPGRSDVLP